METATIKKISLIKQLKSGTVDMTIGSPIKCIVTFAIPLIIGNFFQMLYNWTDAIIIGHFVNQIAFGSISAAMPIISLLLNFVLGFLVGGSVIIGQLFGKKSYDSLRRTVSTSIIVMLIASVIVTIIGMIFTRPLLNFLDVSPKQIEDATSYLTIYFAGCICMLMYNVFAQILRSVGNSFIPLLMLIVGTLINVVLDLVCVAVLDMGVAGAAVATVVSQGISTLLCFIYIQVKLPLLRLSRKDFCFDKPLFRSVLKVAIPSMIQQVCASLGFLIINKLINFGSAEYTTAFGIGNRIDELVTLQVMSFGIAISTFAAQNMSKGLIDRIKKGFKWTMLISLSILVVGGALILIFQDGIIQLFISLNANETVSAESIAMIKDITSTFLYIYIPSYLIFTVMVLTSSLLRGTGDALTSMGVNIVSLIARVSAAIVFNIFWSRLGVFWASPFGWLIGAAWAMLVYFKGSWTKVDILKGIKTGGNKVATQIAKEILQSQQNLAVNPSCDNTSTLAEPSTTSAPRSMEIDNTTQATNDINNDANTHN